jgi:hypothetical protein
VFFETYLVSSPIVSTRSKVMQMLLDKLIQGTCQ